MWHRVHADGLPGPLSRLVLTPKKRGEVTSVELEWPGRLVRCELEFNLGEETDVWTISLDGPVDILAVDLAFGLSIAVDLLPGEYVWTATLTRGDRSRTLKAKLVVPAGEAHEAVLRFE
jgi:hypothetical protein